MCICPFKQIFIYLWRNYSLSIDLYRQIFLFLLGIYPLFICHLNKYSLICCLDLLYQSVWYLWGSCSLFICPLEQIFFYFWIWSIDDIDLHDIHEVLVLDSFIFIFSFEQISIYLWTRFMMRIYMLSMECWTLFMHALEQIFFYLWWSCSLFICAFEQIFFHFWIRPPQFISGGDFTFRINESIIDEDECWIAYN